MRSIITRVTIAAFLATQISIPALAQTKPAPMPEPVTPTPLPGPVTPLPQPVHDRPTPLPGPVTPLPKPVPDRPTPLPGPVAGNGGYAGSLRCDSRNNRIQRCTVRHESRVMLVDRHDGKCNQGRDWGYDRRAIWVSNGCKATFAYGYGSYWPQPEKKNSNTGLIVGGVVVAAGLAALLLSKKKKAPTETAAPEPETPTTFPPGPPAAVSANLSILTAAQKPAMQTCLFEASRQLGATGGTRLTLDSVTEIEPGNGGWRFRANIKGTYPDGDRDMTMYCRATPTKVVQLDFS